MQKVDYEKLKLQLDANEQADFRYQERRHSQWTENYQLYRDKVITNRLTQKQSINVPLIKGIIKTVQANTDEFPDIEHEDLENNKDREIVINELWKNFVVVDKLEIKDAVGKKQDFLYGITHTKLNLVKGRITAEIKEAFDILRDRYANPADYDNTADHMSELGIFRTIDQLRANSSLDQNAVRRIGFFYATTQGLVKAEEVTKQMQDKAERMDQMGVPDVYSPQLGTTVVELKVHLQKIWDDKDQESHWHVIVLCSAGVERDMYAADTAQHSQFPFDSEFHELGYIAIDKKYRGKHLSHRILAKLLSNYDRPLFATTDSVAMKSALRQAGFKREGKEWQGNRGKLSLWLKN